MNEDERLITDILSGMLKAAEAGGLIDLGAVARRILDIIKVAEGYKAISAPTRIFVDASLTKTCIVEEGRNPIVSTHFKDARDARDNGMTTNQMEYWAIIRGLRYARMWQMEHVEILSDSELAVKQINGEYATKNKILARLCANVLAYKTSFVSCKFSWVSREKNPAGKELG